jgi:hypothetical protein
MLIIGAGLPLASKNPSKTQSKKPQDEITAYCLGGQKTPEEEDGYCPGHPWGQKQVPMPGRRVATADAGSRLILSREEMRELPPVAVPSLDG